MNKFPRIMAVVAIMMISLLGALIPATPMFADDPIRTFPDLNLDEQAHIVTGVANTSDIHQSDLDGVTTFFADDHYIVDLTGMEYWTTLNVLNLQYNRIVNISPLANLSALTGLYLDTNFISNISCLVGVLDSGDVLNVQTNALNEEAYTIDIPALEADGVVVYYDEEPYPAPTIPPPPSGNRSVFVLPVVDFLPDEAYFWGMFSYAQGISDCEQWYEVWEEMPLMVYYLTIVQNGYGGNLDLSRALYGFNTSDIPDDAIITDAFLRVVPYWWESDGLGDYAFVVGGTHNTSIFPFIYDGENLVGANYSESEFYGDFGEFTVSDLLITEGEGNYNASFYVDIPFNNDGVDYINPAGLTALSIRAQSDIDRICPNESGSVDLWIWAGQLGQYYYLPDIELIVDWHSPSEDIIITSAPISAMMTIQALLFTFGGILGIMALVMKPELFSFGIRAGLLLGLTIFTVIGVAMLESIIVAIT